MSVTRTRAIPSVGAPVLVAYLATRVSGTVVETDADLRGLVVLTAEGERVRFALSRATGTFLAADTTKARLLFAAPSE